MSIEQIKQSIREVPDFPKAGILFYDISTLLADPAAFAASIEVLAERVAGYELDGLVAIESRGFIFGAPLALKLGLPLQIVRKPGKLPYQTVSLSYDLEYGSDTIEMHVDAVAKGKRYAIIDDLLATGGTAAAAAALVEQQGGVVACCAFVIELGFLSGKDKLGARAVESLLTY